MSALDAIGGQGLAGLTIEAIAAVETAREFRIHPRDRVGARASLRSGSPPRRSR